MTEDRYQSEVRPVVFRLLNAVSHYVQRIGISQAELERAVRDWLDISRPENWRVDRDGS